MILPVAMPYYENRLETQRLFPCIYLTGNGQHLGILPVASLLPAERGWRQFAEMRTQVPYYLPAYQSLSYFEHMDLLHMVFYYFAANCYKRISDAVTVC